jgi:hypothetical protein
MESREMQFTVYRVNVGAKLTDVHGRLTTINALVVRTVQLYAR